MEILVFFILVIGSSLCLLYAVTNWNNPDVQHWGRTVERKDKNNE